VCTTPLPLLRPGTSRRAGGAHRAHPQAPAPLRAGVGAEAYFGSWEQRASRRAAPRRPPRACPTCPAAHLRWAAWGTAWRALRPRPPSHGNPERAGCVGSDGGGNTAARMHRGAHAPWRTSPPPVLARTHTGARARVARRRAHAPWRTSTARAPVRACVVPARACPSDLRVRRNAPAGPPPAPIKRARRVAGSSPRARAPSPGRVLIQLLVALSLPHPCAVSQNQASHPQSVCTRGTLGHTHGNHVARGATSRGRPVAAHTRRAHSSVPSAMVRPARCSNTCAGMWGPRQW